MQPMLASKGDHVPVGGEWSHEVKWDGVRILADSASGSRVRLLSRNGNDVSASWPEVVGAAPAGRDLVVDGEIIALNEQGLPDFRVLQDRIHVTKPATVARLATRVPVTFMVFDLLRLDGHDLTQRPLTERQQALQDLGLSGWQVPVAYDDGAMLLDATRQQGLEGIVSKRRDSTYSFGARSQHWLKFAHRHRGSYVIGGWRPQEGTADRLAAVLVGTPSADGLLFRGRVGSGIGPRVGRLLADLLAPYAATTNPFTGEVPAVDARGTRWVEPVVVIDVDTHQTGPEQRLRQPSYQGVRADLTPDTISKESR